MESRQGLEVPLLRAMLFMLKSTHEVNIIYQGCSGYGHGHETRRICGVAVLDTNADSCEFNVTSTGNVAMTADVMTDIVTNGWVFLISCTQHV